jgi:hypothetical protein
MEEPRRLETSGRCPRAGGGIVELGDRPRGVSAHHQHLARRQDRGRMVGTGDVHRAGGSPQPSRRIVELGARDGGAAGERGRSAGNENAPGRKERRGELDATCPHRAGRRPLSAPGIVELGARQYIPRPTSGDQNHPRGQQCRGVK